MLSKLARLARELTDPFLRVRFRAFLLDILLPNAAGLYSFVSVGIALSERIFVLNPVFLVSSTRVSIALRTRYFLAPEIVC